MPCITRTFPCLINCFEVKVEAEGNMQYFKLLDDETLHNQDKFETLLMNFKLTILNIIDDIFDILFGATYTKYISHLANYDTNKLNHWKLVHQCYRMNIYQLNMEDGINASSTMANTEESALLQLINDKQTSINNNRLVQEQRQNSTPSKAPPDDELQMKDIFPGCVSSSRDFRYMPKATETSHLNLFRLEKDPINLGYRDKDRKQYYWSPREIFKKIRDMFNSRYKITRETEMSTEDINKLFLELAKHSTIYFLVDQDGHDKNRNAIFDIVNAMMVEHPFIYQNKKRVTLIHMYVCKEEFDSEKYFDMLFQRMMRTDAQYYKKNIFFAWSATLAYIKSSSLDEMSQEQLIPNNLFQNKYGFEKITDDREMNYDYDQIVGDTFPDPIIYKVKGTVADGLTRYHKNNVEYAEGNFARVNAYFIDKNRYLQFRYSKEQKTFEYYSPVYSWLPAEQDQLSIMPEELRKQAMANAGLKLNFPRAGGYRIQSSAEVPVQERVSELKDSFYQFNDLYLTENNCVVLSCCALINEMDPENAQKLVDVFTQYPQTFEWLNFTKNPDKIEFQHNEPFQHLLQRYTDYQLKRVNKQGMTYLDLILNFNKPLMKRLRGYFLCTLKTVCDECCHVIGIDTIKGVIFDSMEKYSMRLSYENLQFCCGPKRQIKNIMYCYEVCHK